MIETLNELRKVGLVVLKKELSVLGMIRIFNQNDNSSGDYTEDLQQNMDYQEGIQRLGFRNALSSTLLKLLRKARIDPPKRTMFQ